MAVTGVSEEEYTNYLEHGGTLVFEIDSTNIDPSGEFEESPLIKPYLTSGFELKPTEEVDDESGMQLLLYGGSWTKVVTYTYRRGGNIIYRKLSNGKYEAKVSAPNR